MRLLFYISIIIFFNSCRVKDSVIEYEVAKHEISIPNIKVDSYCLGNYSKEAGDFFIKKVKNIPNNNNKDKILLKKFIYKNENSFIIITGSGFGDLNEEFFLLYYFDNKLSLIIDNDDINEHYKMFSNFRYYNDLEIDDILKIEEEIKDFLWSEVFKKYEELNPNF